MFHQNVKFTMNGGQTKKLKIYWFLWVFLLAINTLITLAVAVKASLHLHDTYFTRSDDKQCLGNDNQTQIGHLQLLAHHLPPQYTSLVFDIPPKQALRSALISVGSSSPVLPLTPSA